MVVHYNIATEVRAMLRAEGWTADFDERYPIYQQIVNRFSHSLVRGELTPGERIPSIRDLAVELRVNTNTIQRAYQEMEREELIFSQRGTGYFVMKGENIVDRVKDKMLQESMSRFLGEMRSLGISNAEIMAQLKEEIDKGGDENGAAHS
jgi:DNA-binding transcriptional regulator YhcF (GntR family)